MKSSDLSPGRELDALVADIVMGFTEIAKNTLTAIDLLDKVKKSPGILTQDTIELFLHNPIHGTKPVASNYSTDINAAWEVLTCGKWSWLLEEVDDEGFVQCYLENEDDGIWVRATCLTAPHAICLAALRAYEERDI